MMKLLKKWKGNNQKFICILLAAILFVSCVYGIGMVTASTTVPTYFEDLGSTLKKNTVDCEAGASVSLGQLSSTDDAFQFKVAVPAQNKQVVLGYCNTGSSNTWAEGYRFTAWRNAENKICYYVYAAAANRIVAENQAVPGEELTVTMWNTKDDTNRTVYLAVNGEVIGSYEHALNAITLGKYVNGETVGAACTFKTVNELDTSVPTDFEDIGTMLGCNTVDCDAGATVSLGQLSSDDKAFQFKVAVPAVTKQVVLGYANTASQNTWANGYRLTVWRNGENTIAYYVNVGGTDRIIKQVSVPGEELTITIWNKQDDDTHRTVYLAVNGAIIDMYRHAKDAFSLGKYINGETVGAACTFKTINEVDMSVPTDFEDLGTTLGFNTVDCAKDSSVYLGQLSSEDKAFQFKVAVPEVSKQVVLGYANTASQNTWAGGYRFTAWRNSENKIVYYVHVGGTSKIEKEVAVPGDELTVTMWTTQNDTHRTVYLGVNGERVGFYKHALNEATLGKYINGETAGAACTFKTINEVDTSVPTEFEDLGMILGFNTVDCAKDKMVSLGQLSSEDKAFQFKVAVPAVNKQVALGYLNTASQNTWEGGYRFTAWRNSENKIVYYVYAAGANRIEKEVAVSGDEITVMLWTTKDDTHRTVHLAVNGEKLGFYKHALDAVKLGKYINGETAGAACTFKTINEVDMSVPTDFEDIGITLKSNTVDCAADTMIALGQLSSVDKAFQFKVAVPAVGKQVALGYCNTASQNVWQGGYRFTAWRNGENKIVYLLNVGGEAVINKEMAVKGDEITVTLWTTKDDTHRTVHLAINGEKIGFYKHALDAVKLGKYINGETIGAACTYQTINKVDTSVPTEFEDISTMMKASKIVCAPKSITQLGYVLDETPCFMVKVQLPEPGSRVQICYGAETATTDLTTGYRVDIAPSQSGKVNFRVYVADKKEIILPINFSKEYSGEITVSIWYTTNGNTRTINLGVNGERLKSYDHPIDSVVVGKYVNCETIGAQGCTLKAVKDFKEEGMPAVFEDIGTTMRKNKYPIVADTVVSLGKLKDKKNGFQFAFVPPTKGHAINIGLYNVGNTYEGGYLLTLWKKDAESLVIIVEAKTGGSKDFVLLGNMTLKNPTEDIKISAWLNYADDELNKHIFNLAVNGEKLVHYYNRDGSVLVNRNLSAYSTLEEDFIIKSITPYVSSYNPTAPNGEVYVSDDETVGKTDKDTKDKLVFEKINPIVYVSLGTVAVVGLGLVVLLILQSKKNKKKSN